MYITIELPQCIDADLIPTVEFLGVTPVGDRLAWRRMPTPSPLNPNDRLLCGPGPSNVSPEALAVMQRPMLGHLDPDCHEILLEVVE